MAENVLAGLKPEGLWRHFDEISRLPRCSKNEERVREHIVIFAKERGLECQVDPAGNVVVRKPAHPLHRNGPMVVVQGHLDMVCEKNQETAHDFAKEAIALARDGEWLHARGTTLGADNGIAVAAALALLSDDSIEHPPLEALFTVDEESGLIGASKLDPELIRGRILLNLDSEEEGIFYVGCAGGQNTEGWFPVQRESAGSGVAATIAVKGLRGGHSGSEIHEGRGNAVALGARLLWRAAAKVPFRLYELSGGGLHNAIPREFFAKALVPADRVSLLAQMAGELERHFKLELGDIEPALSLSVAVNGEKPQRVLTAASTQRVLDTLYAMPHGVVAMSRKIPGLVETSTNLAAVHLEGEEVHLLTSQRSTYASSRDDLADRVTAVVRSAGGRTVYSGVYPSWPPDPDSSLVRTCREVYRRQAGREPQVKAIHAGLECGVIGEKYPGIKMISFGPDIRGAHTPEERVNVPSTERFFNFLIEVLRSL